MSAFLPEVSDTFGLPGGLDESLDILTKTVHLKYSQDKQLNDFVQGCLLHPFYIYYQSIAFKK